MINLIIPTFTVDSSSVVSNSSSPTANFVTFNTTTNRSSVTTAPSVETTSHITTAISLDPATTGKVYTNNLSGGGIAGIVVGVIVVVILVIVTLAYVKRRRSHRHSGKTPNQYLPNKEELQQKEIRGALENTENVITAPNTFQETVPKSEYVNVDSSCNRLENINTALDENGYLKMISSSPAEFKNGKPSSHSNNKNIEKDVIMNKKKSNRKHRTSNAGEKIDPASADNEEQLKKLQYSTVNKDVDSKQHQTSSSVQGQGTSARTYVNMNSNTAGANKAISLCAKSKNADSENISNAEIHYVNEDGYVNMNKTPETIDEISSQDELYEN